MSQGENAPEVMLAQEQAVIRRGPGIRKGVQAAFGFGGETEGTLVLTDRRLVYVHGRERENKVRVGTFSAKRLYFSDVDTLNSIPLDKDAASLEIPFSKVAKVVGHRGEGVDPKLEVSWTGDDGAAHSTEFVQQITGSSRRKNLDDWANVIQRLKAGQIKPMPSPPGPGEDTLEGQILAVLGDMQQKGLLALEEEVEEKYELELDPDEVESACGRLVDAGLVRKFTPRGEDPSFAKVSPLGDDDLGA